MTKAETEIVQRLMDEVERLKTENELLRMVGYRPFQPEPFYPYRVYPTIDPTSVPLGPTITWCGTDSNPVM